MLTLDNYNVAFKNFIKARFENTVWGTPAQAFENAAKEGEDAMSFPLISVYRSDLALASQRNWAAFKTGAPIGVTEKKVTRERVLPFILSYTIDIWSVVADIGEQLFCELLFRLIDNPSIEVQFQGMKSPLIQYFTVTEAVDNTDTSLIATRGRYSRYTIVGQMEAHIAKIVENDRIFIVPEVYNFDGEKFK